MQCACTILSSVACLALLYFSPSHKWHDFRKNSIEHKIFVLVFSTTFTCNIYHSKKELSEIWSKTCISLHVKYPLFLSDINETWIFSTDFRKVLISLHEIPSVGAELFNVDGRTDMTKLLVAFRNLAKARKKWTLLWTIFRSLPDNLLS